MIDIKAMKKDDIVWLATNRCKSHGRTYLEHPCCFEKERPKKILTNPIIGSLDIETSNLKANYAIILSYAIKIHGSKKLIGRALTPEEMHSDVYDRDLIRECIDAMSKLDVCVTFYGSRFDIPTIRTRALFYKIPFPKHGTIKSCDVWRIARGKLNLHSNRLENICSFYGIPAKQHKMSPQVWTKSLSGDQKALDYVWAHNKEDVYSLEKVYNLLIPFSHGKWSSI